MKKALLLLLLTSIIFISGCLSPPPPDVKFTQCELKETQLKAGDTTSLFIVIKNNDQKFYQNVTLSFDKSEKIKINKEGNEITQPQVFSLNPSYSFSLAFDVKGILDTGVTQSTYTISIPLQINGNNVDTCSLSLVVSK